MTWDDENYYLIAYDEAVDVIKHYRVDKMQQVRVSETKRVGGEKDFEILIWQNLQKRHFACMADRRGSDAACRNGLVGVIMDRFGQGSLLIPEGDTHFRVHILVSVSRQFFGWITGIGKEMQIIGPESVKEEYKKYLQKILEEY